MPDTIAGYIEDWRRLHPDDQIEVWNSERALGELILTPVWRSLYLDVEHWSPTSNVWQYRSNIFRLLKLYCDGGLWVDADLKPLKNIWPLIGDAEVAAARENDRFLNNGILWASRPGMRFYQDCVSTAAVRIRQHRHWRSNKQCGPHLITEVASRYPEVNVIPTEAVYPLSYRDARAGVFDIEVPHTAYAIHAWNNARNQQGRPLP